MFYSEEQWGKDVIFNKHWVIYLNRIKNLAPDLYCIKTINSEVTLKTKFKELNQQIFWKITTRIYSWF